MSSQFLVGTALTAVLLPFGVQRLRRANQILAAVPVNPVTPTMLAPVYQLPVPRPSDERSLHTDVHSEEPLEALPAPVSATVDPTPPGSAVAVLPATPAPVLAEGAAPGLPDVTPLESLEKAGQVRRGQGPPCHECTCCDVYATRIAAAHTEIDRLRVEVEFLNAQGLRRAAARQTGHGI